jgi:CRISPR system Cascade subunit CasD
MRDYLVFALTAAIGSMGDLAGHERLGTETWPGRSAILGLIAAAIGIRRDGDFAALDGMGLAVATFDAGEPLRDYHTVETVPSAATRELRRPPHSRAEALAVAGRGTNTTVTIRDYRCGPVFGVALWDGPLEEIEAALLRPAFAPYFGRRACSLSSPITPRRVPAPDAATALQGLTLPPWLGRRTARSLHTEEPTTGGRVEERRDCPTDRARRHFAARRVAVLPVEITSGPASEAA